jgi:acetyltransferase-like isoleucine patch superfamily enzyme
MFTIRYKWNKMIELIGKWRFARSCSRVGKNLSIHGRCIIAGDGIIELGEDIIIKSPKYNPVDIFVGAKAHLYIGNGTFLNRGTHISCSDSVHIGDNCLIADECIIIDNDYHAVGVTPAKIAPIHIGNRVWLALRVIVLRGVTIGEGSVVAAGSVVNRSIPPYSFAAGVPARVIKSLRPNQS